MKLKLIKVQLITTFAFVAFMNVGCNDHTSLNTNQDKVESIFSKGELGPADHFTGKAWNIGLVADDTTYNTVVGTSFLNQVQEVTGTPIRQDKY